MKTFKLILIIIIFSLCLFLARYIYNEKNEKTKEVFSKSEDIFLLQYGVYSSKENMEDNTSNLSNYFYYSENDLYHVLIGITQKEELIDKIKDSYYITDNIYSKKVNINNEEFLLSLKQYDTLIDQTSDKNIIINAEKQILSKYEELILRSE